MEIISEVRPLSKIRSNLWQASDGAVIGFGTLLALASPGHSAGGLYYCFTCNGPECQHTQTVDETWASGEESAEDEPLEFSDDDELIFASSADLWPDDYAIESYV